MKNITIQKFADKTAKIGIVGLGYVGLPLMLRYVDIGYQVLGFEQNNGFYFADAGEVGRCFKQAVGSSGNFVGRDMLDVAFAFIDSAEQIPRAGHELCDRHYRCGKTLPARRSSVVFGIYQVWPPMTFGMVRVSKLGLPGSSRSGE
jgi:hypothetical protein